MRPPLSHPSQKRRRRARAQNPTAVPEPQPPRRIRVSLRQAGAASDRRSQAEGRACLDRASEAGSAGAVGSTRSGGGSIRGPGSQPGELEDGVGPPEGKGPVALKVGVARRVARRLLEHARARARARAHTHRRPTSRSAHTHKRALCARARAHCDPLRNPHYFPPPLAWISRGQAGAAERPSPARACAAGHLGCQRICGRRPPGRLQGRQLHAWPVRPVARRRGPHGVRERMRLETDDDR